MKHAIFTKWIRKQKIIVKVILFVPMMLFMMWELTTYFTIWFVFGYNNFLIYILLIPLGIIIREYYFDLSF